MSSMEGDPRQFQEIMNNPESFWKEFQAMKAKLAAQEQREVVEVEFNGEWPKYQLNAMCFLDDDIMHQAGEILEYDGTPNLEMVPQNEPARKRMQSFLDMLNEAELRAAEAGGRAPRRISSDMDYAHFHAVSLLDMKKIASGQVAHPVHVMPTAIKDPPPVSNSTEAIAEKKRRGRPPGSGRVISVAQPKSDDPALANQKVTTGVRATA